MKKQNYVAPEIETVSVELEKGIAQSGGGSVDYGNPGEAGGGGDESGYTEW